MSALAQDGVAAAGRVAIASSVAVAMTALSLVGVRALTQRSAPAPEEPESSVAMRMVPLTPPPQPAEPEPIASPETVRAASREASPSPVDPPAPTPPALAGLAPSAAPGSLALGPIGDLPSVGELPEVEVETEPGAAESADAPVTPARVTSRPAAQYPALAQRRGIEGHVTLRLRIDERGRVVDAVVVESEPKGIFDSAAKRAARKYRFTPARSGTKPVASTLQQTIRFELER